MSNIVNKSKTIRPLVSSITACVTAILVMGCQQNVNTIVEEKSVKKPNFVWLVSEDNSKDYLKLYNPKGASMPNVESLAQQGLVFNNALSNAPVCSTARTTLALGAYPAKLAMEYHRPYQRINLPNGLAPISEYLTKAGYHTTNNYKEDYNFVEPAPHWSASVKGADWRNREKDQPFFHMQSWKTTHEHKLHFPESDIQDKPTKHDPKLVDLAPIHPDTELFRYTHARYLDQHQKVDTEIGVIIKQLEEEGVLEDTFVFFFGDHGGVLPGSKGYAYERGLNVPLVVRIPKNFRHLVHTDLQAKLETRVDGFVNFIDFAPTLLKLAGIEGSPLQDGKPFLSKELSLEELNARDTHFAFADRFDEKYDMVRTYRKGKYKYIRHYLPFNPDGLFSTYRYKQAAYREWKELYKKGELNDAQSAFFKVKPVEALYNVEDDFYETNNLASDPKTVETLVSMRTGLQEQLRKMPDLAFYPEYHLVKVAQDNVIGFGEAHQSEIKTLMSIADLSLKPFNKVKDQLIQALLSDNQWHRYWGLNTALSFSEQAMSLLPLIQKIKDEDSNNLNRSRAIQYIALNNGLNPKNALEQVIANTNDTAQVLAHLNIATQLHDELGTTFDIPFRKSWAKPGKEVKDKAESWRRRTVYTWFKARVDYLKQK
jgi:arylsulfatase A-like enzyme